MRMAERDLELEPNMPSQEDYPPEYLEDYTRWLALMETICDEEFDREQQ